MSVRIVNVREVTRPDAVLTSRLYLVRPCSALLTATLTAAAERRSMRLWSGVALAAGGQCLRSWRDAGDALMPDPTQTDTGASP